MVFVHFMYLFSFKIVFQYLIVFILSSFKQLSIHCVWIKIYSSISKPYICFYPISLLLCHGPTVFRNYSYFLLIILFLFVVLVSEITAFQSCFSNSQKQRRSTCVTVAYLLFRCVNVFVFVCILIAQVVVLTSKPVFFDYFTRIVRSYFLLCLILLLFCCCRVFSHLFHHFCVRWKINFPFQNLWESENQTKTIQMDISVSHS